MIKRKSSVRDWKTTLWIVDGLWSGLGAGFTFCSQHNDHSNTGSCWVGLDAPRCLHWLIYKHSELDEFMACYRLSGRFRSKWKSHRSQWVTCEVTSRFRSISKLAACPLDGCAVFVGFFFPWWGGGRWCEGNVAEPQDVFSMDKWVDKYQWSKPFILAHIGWWLLSPTSHIMMDTGFKPSKLGNSTFKHVKWWLLYIYMYRDLPWCFIKTKFLFKTWRWIWAFPSNDRS